MLQAMDTSLKDAVRTTLTVLPPLPTWNEIFTSWTWRVNTAFSYRIVN